MKKLKLPVRKALALTGKGRSEMEYRYRVLCKLQEIDHSVIQTTGTVRKRPCNSTGRLQHRQNATIWAQFWGISRPCETERKRAHRRCRCTTCQVSIRLVLF